MTASVTASVNPSATTRFLLATSNGTGMGHLARQAAVALAFKDPSRVALFSLSTAVHVVARQGLRAEYCPSHHRGWMPQPAWHRYLADRVSALLDETGAKVFAFDGVAPYLGLLKARGRHRDVAFVWCRRGMWRPTANARLLELRSFFDLVVEPGDLASAADRGAPSRLADAVRVPPISQLEHSPLLPRAEAAAALGLDSDRPTALVTLGAGTINDTQTPAMAAIQAFLSDPEWQVAVTRAPLAQARLPEEDVKRVHELVDVYPLAQYLSAFDAAVSASGYNSVHELVPAAVPTVFVPNAATPTDDQVGRARQLEADGLALHADEDPSAVADGVRRLLDSGIRAELRARCEELPPVDGSTTVAALLSQLSGEFRGHERTFGRTVRAIDVTAREFAMRALGQRGITLARRALRKAPQPGPNRRLRVRPLVIDQLDPAVLRGDQPVEHLLPDSSNAYRTRRLEIAHDAYTWPA